MHFVSKLQEFLHLNQSGARPSNSELMCPVYTKGKDWEEFLRHSLAGWILHLVTAWETTLGTAVSLLWGLFTALPSEKT